MFGVSVHQLSSNTYWFYTRNIAVCVKGDEWINPGTQPLVSIYFICSITVLSSVSSILLNCGKIKQVKVRIYANYFRSYFYLDFFHGEWRDIIFNSNSHRTSMAIAFKYEVELLILSKLDSIRWQSILIFDNVQRRPRETYSR